MIRPPDGSRSRSSATARSLDDLREGARFEDGEIAPGDRRAVGLEELEEPLVAERGHLDRLAQSGPELAFGERPQHGDVDHDGRRLVEGTDEVLAFGEVDAGLAADRRIDLGHEGRRDLDEPDAAEVDRGKEPGRIAERPATNRDERLGSLDAEGRKLAGRAFDHVEPFGSLAFGKEEMDDLATTFAQAAGQSLANRGPGAGLADEDRAPGTEQVELAIEGGRRDPVAEHDPPDRRGDAQEGGARGRTDLAEPRHHRIDDAVDLGDTALGDVGGSIEPLAFHGETTERADRIAAGHQRPDVGGTAQALGEDLGTAVEPDRRAAPVERPAIARVEDGAATGRDDAAHVRRGIGRAEGGDRRSFAIAERGLALVGEELRDRPSRGRFDPLVEIDQGRAVPVGQPPSDDALATPRQPDQDDVHGDLSRPRRSRPRPSR